MNKFFLVVLLLGIYSVPSVMAETAPVTPKKQTNLQVHGDGNVTSRLTMVDVVKKQKLAGYTARTVGEAFGNYRYFSKVEWKESPGDGKTYVDFSGMLKKSMFSLDFYVDDTAVRNVEAKFVVYNSGDFGLVMMTLVEFKHDGTQKRTVLTDMGGVLNSIYANNKIRFR